MIWWNLPVTDFPFQWKKKKHSFSIVKSSWLNETGKETPKSEDKTNMVKYSKGPTSHWQTLDWIRDWWHIDNNIWSNIKSCLWRKILLSITDVYSNINPIRIDNVVSTSHTQLPLSTAHEPIFMNYYHIKVFSWMFAFEISMKLDFESFNFTMVIGCGPKVYKTLRKLIFFQLISLTK